MPTEPDPVEEHENPEAMHHRPQRWLKPALLGGLVLAAIVVAVGVTGRVVANQNLKTWTADQAVPTVAAISPIAQTGGQNLVLPGDVQAYYDASIHARVSGYLKHWYQDIGAHVRSGQVLADIDTPDLDQQLAQAKADMAVATANQKLAQTTAARWSGLLSQDAVSQQESEEKSGDFQAKTALVNAAKADVNRLEALESFKHITAPFDGVVTARTTDVGALIAAGAPTDPGLFTVSDTHRLRIYVHVPQSYSAELKPGTTATLTVPEYPGRTFQATLVSTSDAVSAQSGTLLVELQIDNADQALKPGDYAQVQFALPSVAGGVSVPASALMFRQSGMAVAVIGADGRIAMRPVTIAEDLGATVDIASGLSATDRIVDNPPDSLATGDKVRIAAPSRSSNPPAGA